MRIRGRRRRAVGFLILGACLVALATAFNVGWIVLNWREGVLLVLGLLLFPLIVAGLVLNTIFLVREIRRNEQHNAFINAVTHELKTPVASIRLYLETLQSREVAPAQRQEFYRVMLADSDRLLATVEQILRTGRASHAHRPAARQRLELAALVRESVGLVAARYDLPAGALALAVAPEAEGAAVRGDADELRAAISNLLDNAVKYSDSGGQVPQIQVRLGAAERPGAWALRVSDSGVGIPRTELKAIFKRFYRVPNLAAQVGGTGLGLFIVRSVVRRHGGRVWAESAGPGQGSTFTLQLPAAPAERAA
ncbi:MAG TPA: HAMP domain-containing sensor histidine kinase [Terriglobales bacterium]|nr:HAMP domain-containing sensor histidine kinase [Terriglobales bacterium]